ncbi:PilZ domain-containing protein [Sphingomicrobium clamense]|uniref:PilZ domain-containing protein n=1 Tax=Sphingomicrobium clamense TaxID=2851013 RepID=A0ABS6V822_9SPHN|nr:PilZ domain-containing protein [Sphingomicrobium sp. B8]MBW0145631.1 hypothetical protein [Sphingomicrobium sp. B8]
MGQLLPVEPGKKARRSPRSGLYMAAMLRHRGSDCTVIVRNISERGAMVEADCLPERGSAIELIRADLRAVGAIAWQQDDQAGIEFAAKVNLARWAPGLRHREQMEVDKMVAEVRGAKADEATEDTAPSVDLQKLDRRIAEELGMLSRRVGRALESLSGFAPLIARHPRDLQELEVVEQHLARLDKVMASPDRQRAVEALGVEDMRRRLLR